MERIILETPDTPSVHALAIAEALIAKGQRVAICESTAGGLISANLLAVPGASAWFDRGVVAYGGTSKQDSTGVTTETLRALGAVSVEGVEAMALGLQAFAKVDWTLAESGIAGPQTSRRTIKPAGTVCLAIAGPNGKIVLGETLLLPGDRIQVMAGIVEAALARLRTALEG